MPRTGRKCRFPPTRSPGLVNEQQCEERQYGEDGCLAHPRTKRSGGRGHGAIDVLPEQKIQPARRRNDRKQDRIQGIGFPDIPHNLARIHKVVDGDEVEPGLEFVKEKIFRDSIEEQHDEDQEEYPVNDAAEDTMLIHPVGQEHQQQGERDGAIGERNAIVQEADDPEGEQDEWIVRQPGKGPGKEDHPYDYGLGQENQRKEQENAESVLECEKCRKSCSYHVVHQGNMLPLLPHHNQYKILLIYRPALPFCRFRKTT
jgi:hypothetical protein